MRKVCLQTWCRPQALLSSFSEENASHCINFRKSPPGKRTHTPKPCLTLCVPNKIAANISFIHSGLNYTRPIFYKNMRISQKLMFITSIPIHNVLADHNHPVLESPSVTDSVCSYSLREFSVHVMSMRNYNITSSYHPAKPALLTAACWTVLMVFLCGISL